MQFSVGETEEVRLRWARMVESGSATRLGQQPEFPGGSLDSPVHPGLLVGTYTTMSPAPFQLIGSPPLPTPRQFIEQQFGENNPGLVTAP